MGGSSGKAGKSTGSLPYWMQQPHKTLVGNAESFAYGDRGAYVPYPDIRIAGLTDPELGANVARQEMFNRGDPASEWAASNLESGLDLVPGLAGVAFSEFTPGEMERRMSPYMEGVVRPQLREAEESFERAMNLSEAESIAKGGAMGSYRQMLEQIGLQGQKAESLSDIRGRGQQSAYEDALRSFLADRDTRLSGLGQSIGAYQGLAGAGSQLGTDNQARLLSNITELERSGAIPRELEQRELDLAYTDFVEERDFPMNRMQFVSSMLSGLPSAQYGQTTIQPPQPGIASQLASLGLGAAAISQLFPPTG